MCTRGDSASELFYTSCFQTLEHVPRNALSYRLLRNTPRGVTTVRDIMSFPVGEMPARISRGRSWISTQDSLELKDNAQTDKRPDN